MKPSAQNRLLLVLALIGSATTLAFSQQNAPPSVGGAVIPTKPPGSQSDGILSTSNQKGSSARELTANKPTNQNADPNALVKPIQVQGDPTIPSGPPPIVFDPPIMDLGEMQADVPKTGKLTIRNVTDKPVTIARAIAGCGCTTANAPKDPIPAGGSTEMEITLKPGPKQGVKMSKRVTFQIEGAAPIILTVEGNVAAYVTITPDVIEGPAKANEPGNLDGKLVLAAADGQAFKVIGVNPPVISNINPDTATEHIMNIDWAKWEEQGRAIKVSVATDHPKASSLSVMIKRPMVAGDRPTPPPPTQRPSVAPTSELVLAAQQGNVVKVKELLAVAGVNVNQVDGDTGRTALHWAARENRGEIIAILIEAKADVNAQDRTGKGPLTLAAETGSVDATQKLVDAGASLTTRDSIGGTPLTWGCALGSAETVKILLAKGADATVVDVNGLTPLIWAAGIGKPETVALLLEKYPNLDLNIKDGITGDSALMRAVRGGKLESVRMLIERRADVNSVNKQGYTPLQLAALSGSREKAILLIDANADLNAKDATGRTALDLAQRRTDDQGKQIYELLLSKGAVSAVPVPDQTLAIPPAVPSAVPPAVPPAK
ncbi:MAG: ankyrin repeat domain-containing protein [Planctomycetota bacterium]|nr:ankyrin repeat domain-containing protein [Planctomycetota bacterium]